jgi:hypothetical protein
MIALVFRLLFQTQVPIWPGTPPGPVQNNGPKWDQECGCFRDTHSRRRTKEPITAWPQLAETWMESIDVTSLDGGQALLPVSPPKDRQECLSSIETATADYRSGAGSDARHSARSWRAAGVP